MQTKMADGEHWEGQGAKERVAHKADNHSPERTVSSDDGPACAEGQWCTPRGTAHTLSAWAWFLTLPMVSSVIFDKLLQLSVPQSLVCIKGRKHQYCCRD